MFHVKHFKNKKIMKKFLFVLGTFVLMYFLILILWAFSF